MNVSVCLCVHLALRFGFERTMYSELEGRNETVCVVLLSPLRLERPATPQVSSEDIDATGEWKWLQTCPSCVIINY